MSWFCVANNNVGVFVPQSNQQEEELALNHTGMPRGDLENWPYHVPSRIHLAPGGPQGTLPTPKAPLGADLCRPRSPGLCAVLRGTRKAGTDGFGLRLFPAPCAANARPRSGSPGAAAGAQGGDEGLQTDPLISCWGISCCAGQTDWQPEKSPFREKSPFSASCS